MRNSILKKLQRFAKDPVFSFKRKVVNTFPKMSPDKWFLQVKFYKYMGYKLDLKHPKTFNEKLQWLKLYDRNPLYTTLVDKYRVKQYVAEKIGEEYVIPTLAVYKSVDEIDLDKLPNQFVLKCNHDSGSIIICRDKSTFDLAAAKKKLNKALKYNYYLDSREWPYKNVARCIFAEEYIYHDDDLYDYKFFCFNGSVKYYKIDYDRSSIHHATYFDREGNELPYYEVVCPKIENKRFDILYEEIETMISLSENLSKKLPFARVDFYCNSGAIKFGECTLYPTAGFGTFSNLDFEMALGDCLNIIQVNK